MTLELEKSVMTWIWIQSSTPLTFKLPGAAYDISSRCLYRGRLLWLSGVSRRGRKEAAVIPRSLGNREPFGDSKPSPSPQWLEVSFALRRGSSNAELPPGM